MSALLCNFYYGNIEKHLLADVGFDMDHTIPVFPHLLLRMTDDFLLITTDKNMSTAFMRKMQEGRPKLGVHINGTKSQTSYSFELTSDGSIKDTKSLVKQGEHYVFPFAGFLLNVKDCAPQIDYRRFQGDKALNSLTIGRGPCEGNQFLWRLKTFAKPRCKPILFDSRLNSLEEIRINFYHVVAFSAIKIKHYVDGMPGRHKQNPRFLAHSCTELVDYSFNLICSNLRNVEKAQTNVKELWLSSKWMSKGDATWLGMHAMKNVLLYKNDNFKVVLRFMTEPKNNTSGSELLDVAQKALSQFDVKKFSNKK